VRQNVAYSPLFIEQLKRSFNKNNINIIIALAGRLVSLFVKFYFGRCPFFHSLYSYIRRIADHRVKPAFLHDFRKFGVPIKGVDPIDFRFVKEAGLLVVVEIRSDQGVAAFDVVRQVRQDPLLKQEHLLADALLVLAFQHLEQQGQLGYLHRLMIDVHPVNVVQQNPLALAGGQPPFAFRGLVDAGGFAFGPVFRAILNVLIPVPVQQKLIRADQKRARTAGRVQYFQMADPAPGAGLFAFHQFAHGVLNNIVHDVARRVVNPARLADLGFFLDFRLMPAGEADDLAQKFFIDLAQNIGRENGKFVGAVRVIVGF